MANGETSFPLGRLAVATTCVGVLVLCPPLWQYVTFGVSVLFLFLFFRQLASWPPDARLHPGHRDKSFFLLAAALLCVATMFKTPTVIDRLLSAEAMALIIGWLLVFGGWPCKRRAQVEHAWLICARCLGFYAGTLLSCATVVWMWVTGRMPLLGSPLPQLLIIGGALLATPTMVNGAARRLTGPSRREDHDVQLFLFGLLVGLGELAMAVGFYNVFPFLQKP